MLTKREAKREDLRQRLIDAAEAQIVNHGLKGLKARDVTSAAGCSLGALYNVVDDLDGLVILVNSRTLTRLGDALRNAVPANAPPAATLQSLARAYVDFVIENTRTWSALFSFRLPEGADVPDWHKKEHDVLIENIIAPLSQLRPDLGPDNLRLRAQTMFAAVHGVVELSNQGRHIGTPPEYLKSEIDALVDALTRGSHLIES